MPAAIPDSHLNRTLAVLVRAGTTAPAVCLSALKCHGFTDKAAAKAAVVTFKAQYGDCPVVC